jgi:hypothetical protein
MNFDKKDNTIGITEIVSASIFLLIVPIILLTSAWVLNRTLLIAALGFALSELGLVLLRYSLRTVKAKARGLFNKTLYGF